MELWIARDIEHSKHDPWSDLWLYAGEPRLVGRMHDTTYRRMPLGPRFFPDLLPGQKRRMWLVAAEPEVRIVFPADQNYNGED